MAASPSSGIEQGRFDAPADSGATTTTSLTFETLPLTPPGKSSERLEEEATSSVTSSSSPFSFSHGSVFNSHAPLPPPPPTLSFPPYAPSVRGETGGGALLPSAVPGAAEGGGGDQVSSFTRHSSFHYASDRQQSRILSPVPDLARKPSFLSRVPSALARNNAVVAAHPFSPTTYFGGEDWTTPPPQNYGKHSKSYYEMAVGESKTKVNGFWINMVRIMRPGSRPNKRLLVLIILNFAYSTAEFLIGLFTGRIGLVSDSFHLTFGCGVLAFSLYAMMVAEQSPSDTYTYGYCPTVCPSLLFILGGAESWAFLVMQTKASIYFLSKAYIVLILHRGTRGWRYLLLLQMPVVQDNSMLSVCVSSCFCFSSPSLLLWRPCMPLLKMNLSTNIT